MASYITIAERARNSAVQAQVAVAIATDAKYNAQTSADPDTKAWAVWVTPRTTQEAANWAMVVCTDPAIADAVEVSDANIQAAVTALVPTMVASYLAQQPPAV